MTTPTVSAPSLRWHPPRARQRARCRPCRLSWSDCCCATTASATTWQGRSKSATPAPPTPATTRPVRRRAEQSEALRQADGSYLAATTAAERLLTPGRRQLDRTYVYPAEHPLVLPDRAAALS
ncbi:hypothetical protein ACIQF5_21115 [Streptomyces goshikiensis]|uniref:hypothetical protein n=1 Tax=Streptomyces goshikiensis TaxID=1942 RepID=UPI00382E0693